ncbi:arsenate reductase (thioredoxin) [Vagococcus fluvialis]|jgi:arsenate reductase|uniref:Arsenate reductase (Thioredoxin) n=1 Tax=Vagococcus fluvialis TaxID=2738 RepID=A0A369AZW9_9ENTE|nr:arsenate reductase (thioredoxin) [Vagococcus fluvialis]MDR2278180.1 arsenate reductase (thioredoxin) [Vagococcus sp.]MDR2994367.1 arsenate reductase (thioredoxin) [Bacillus cereus]OTP31201.1 arsenate reductase (thioredoxin) [Enterococcus sp. 6C8_DIV0013]MBO0418829.1 arsenate reductase (thioredoxin) [Vagococcus fluvialis]MBO0444527.1 arsenate reductase (thioredoxin) [Vagococcus fluvialis]
MKKIYFLCTGNSCRSQIADGLAKSILNSNEWEVRSAGIEAHGINPRAVKIMNEINIDISQNKSEIIDIDYLNSSDLVITLCGDALDNCPVIPKNVEHQHWGLEDPAKATGTEGEIMAMFRETREEIERRIKLI